MTDSEYESIYPERVEVECPICHCRHWKPGRCFAGDERGWPIVQAIQGRRGMVNRMTAAETRAAVKAPRPGEGTAWWAA
jgi:hypothetical protein